MSNSLQLQLAYNSVAKHNFILSLLVECNSLVLVSPQGRYCPQCMFRTMQLSSILLPNVGRG